jgi:hypothetical protein
MTWILATVGALLLIAERVQEALGIAAEERCLKQR